MSNHEGHDLSNEHLSWQEKDFQFAMQCNGYYMLENGEWKFYSENILPIGKEFEAQRISFFGPTSNDAFFGVPILRPSQFIPAFKQGEVIDVIRKYRNIHDNQATRIAFLLGGVVRHLAYPNPDSEGNALEIAKAVKFAARMTMLGEKRSGDAIASAMAMYIISGGSFVEDNHFTGNVYHMADAVREDPITPVETKDLGLSQVARLRTFVDTLQGKDHKPFPEIASHESAFEKFPTVGAEFHFSLDTPRENSTFWNRLALLNISQYQRGSYIQLSKNDRNVVEVRMNPSIYPVTIANWNYIRLLLPEINQAFFTATINRKDANGNFSWGHDREILNRLRALGMLSYANLFENVPRIVKKEEINFGEVYLGQTIKMKDGKYMFEGNWGGGRGQHGQMGIHAGFGDNFPDLAYYPSMALANPQILSGMHSVLRNINTPQDALAIRPSGRKEILTTIQRRVEADKRLNYAYLSGKKIIEQLNP